MQKLSPIQQFWKSFGPGVLFACTAIGVSHLVQSTRAGAEYGFALWWAILAANLFKYPFFEYGSRYAAATGESIIDGYHRLGKLFLILYMVITMVSMFFVAAAVGFVAAGFMENLFGIELAPQYKLVPSAVLFTVCLAILLIGKYSALDGLLKLVGGVLFLTTAAAFVIALFHGPEPTLPEFTRPKVWNESGILFLVALMGWMPTAVDLSAWNSLWTLERARQTGYRVHLRSVLQDFNLGYWISAGLSFCFLTLGAFLIFGTGKTMPDSSGAFAGEIVHLYTTVLGPWSYWIIAASAFSVMFSTTIGVLDGYARSMERVSEILFLKGKKRNHVYSIWMLITGIGAFLILSQFLGQLKALVDLATTVSFIIAPAVAVMNFVLVSKKYVPGEAVPPLWMRILSYAGIVFLSGFTILFVYTKITGG